MGGSSSTRRGDDGESAMEEPDEAWVGEHLDVERLDDEHGGGVAVRVRKLAWKGADAGADVAKTGAWLHAHGREVKAFNAKYRTFTRVRAPLGVMCVRNVHGCVDGCSWL